MSSPATTKQIPPLYEVMMGFKNTILADIRCCVPGTVKGVHAATGTVDVEVALMQPLAGGVSTKYPILNNCPSIVMRGGGVAAVFPISIGDQCLVFFSDRCIDNWWKTGTPQPLPNYRMHNLSDGFALVGINASTNPLVTALLPTEGGIASLLAKVAIDKTTGLIAISNQTQNLLTIPLGLSSGLTTFVGPSGDNSVISLLIQLVTILISSVDTGGYSFNPATVSALSALNTKLATLSTTTTAPLTTASAALPALLI